MGILIKGVLMAKISEDKITKFFFHLYYFYIKVIFIIQLFNGFFKDNIYNPKVNNF